MASKKVPVWPNRTEAIARFVHPRDRNGKMLRHRCTKASVQDALDNYVSSCKQLVRMSLRHFFVKHVTKLATFQLLCRHRIRILPCQQPQDHAAIANVLRWSMAEVCDIPMESLITQECKFVWCNGPAPGWMVRSVGPIHFHLNGLFLLSAPNISWKRPLMRSLAAAGNTDIDL